MFNVLKANGKLKESLEEKKIEEEENKEEKEVKEVKRKKSTPGKKFAWSEEEERIFYDCINKKTTL